jgi:hypothetical protein
VEPINGYNLITWKGTADASANYTLYRKSIIDGEIDEGTIKVVGDSRWTSSNVGITPIKAISYVQDWDIETDVQYVYGVVSRGYKDGYNDVNSISDLVWQDEPEGGYVKAKKPAAGTAVAAAPAVTVVGTPVRGNSSTPTTAGVVNVNDSIVITVKGLTPGYTYRFGIAYTNQTTPNDASPAALNESNWGSWGGSGNNVVGSSYTDSNGNSASAITGNASYYRGWTWINGGSNVFSVQDYLDYGDTIELPETWLEYYNGSTSWIPGFSDYSSASKHYLEAGLAGFMSGMVRIMVPIRLLHTIIALLPVPGLTATRSNCTTLPS